VYRRAAFLLGNRPAFDAALPSLPLTRNFTTGNGNGSAASLFVSDISLSGHRTPLLIGLVSYFERHLPKVGYFQPIAAHLAPNSELKLDRTIEL
jgi:phosphate acetyltransferase